MRNISVPTNDTMVYAVHGNTVDECVADCARLMAYLTANSVPENVEDEEDEHPDDCYCSYTYEDEDDDDDDDYDDGDDDTVDDEWLDEITGIIADIIGPF